jgi:hypothetical protein
MTNTSAPTRIAPLSSVNVPANVPPEDCAYAVANMLTHNKTITVLATCFIQASSICGTPCMVTTPAATRIALIAAKSLAPMYGCFHVIVAIAGSYKWAMLLVLEIQRYTLALIRGDGTC